METERDGFDLIVAILDQPGERSPFRAGRISERYDHKLGRQRRDRQRQFLDHLAPDIENMRAGSLTLEIFLRRALVDLPCEKCGRDFLGIKNPNYEKVGGANSFALDGVECQSKIPGATSGEYDVPNCEKGRRSPGRQRNSLNFTPTDTEVRIDITHLNNCNLTAGKLVNRAAKRITRRNGRDIAERLA